jgi:hypothetical protein
MQEIKRVLTLGDVARLHGLPVWKVRRLFERKLLAEPERVGRFRVIAATDLPNVESALRDAGYLLSSAPARQSTEMNAFSKRVET